MSERKLKAGVLGLSEEGLALLKVASAVEHFEIVAVGDKDGTVAEKVAEQYQCAGFDDYRQLITEVDSRSGSGVGDSLRRNDIGCLLVAGGMYSCDEQVRMAMKKKFNVLKLAPAARNFEEAAVFVRLAEDEGVKFAIASPMRFARSYLALHEYLQQGRMEQVFLITALCSVGNNEHPAWHTDPKLSGGGALLRDCYGLIDQILWNFPAPEQVYSLNTNLAADKQQRHYLTEDTAVVAMKFSDTLTGNIVGSKAFGPREEFLKLYGKDRIVTVSNTCFSVSDGRGQKIEESEYEDDDVSCMKAVLENFALSILSPEKNKLCSSGRDNLKNMAVIESAYLSARTGMAEEPGRILQMVQIEPTEI